MMRSFDYKNKNEISKHSQNSLLIFLYLSSFFRSGSLVTQYKVLDKNISISKLNIIFSNKVTTSFS